MPSKNRANMRKLFGRRKDPGPFVFFSPSGGFHLYGVGSGFFSSICLLFQEVFGHFWQFFSWRWFRYWLRWVSGCVYLSFYLPVYLFVCLAVYQYSFYLSVYLSSSIRILHFRSHHHAYVCCSLARLDLSIYPFIHSSSSTSTQLG